MRQTPATPECQWPCLVGQKLNLLSSAAQVVFVVDEDKYVKRFVLQQQEGRGDAATQT